MDVSAEALIAGAVGCELQLLDPEGWRITFHQGTLAGS